MLIWLLQLNAILGEWIVLSAIMMAGSARILRDADARVPPFVPRWFRLVAVTFAALTVAVLWLPLFCFMMIGRGK